MPINAFIILFKGQQVSNRYSSRHLLVPLRCILSFKWCLKASVISEILLRGVYYKLLQVQLVYGVSLQAVMAANTKKRLFGLCKTYRAEPKDNVGVFVELEYIKCIKIFDTQLQLFRNFWIV